MLHDFDQIFSRLFYLSIAIGAIGKMPDHPGQLTSTVLILVLLEQLTFFLFFPHDDEVNQSVIASCSLWNPELLIM